MWNGHFQSKVLHPLFVFNQFGDLERCVLRPGNVHSADGWKELLSPVLARYSAKARPSITRRRFRGDAAFAIPAYSICPYILTTLLSGSDTSSSVLTGAANSPVPVDITKP